MRIGSVLCGFLISGCGIDKAPEMGKSEGAKLMENVVRCSEKGDETELRNACMRLSEMNEREAGEYFFELVRKSKISLGTPRVIAQYSFTAMSTYPGTEQLVKNRGVKVYLFLPRGDEESLIDVVCVEQPNSWEYSFVELWGYSM